MNKTMHFVSLDFFTIKPYLTIKTLMIMTAIFAVISYGTGSGAMIIGMLMMYSTFYVAYPFAVGEKNSMDTLYASLPITKRNIVAGRYLFALLLNIVMGVAAFVIATAMMLIFQKEFSLYEMAISAVLCFVLYTVMQSIQLPIYFKLGYARAKLLSYLPLAGLPAVVIAASSIFGKEKWLPMLENASNWMQKNIAVTVILIVVIWAVSMVVSMMMSYRFYRKREF